MPPGCTQEALGCTQEALAVYFGHSQSLPENAEYSDNRLFLQCFNSD